MSEERTTRRPKRKGGGFGPGRPAEKAKDFKGTVKKLIRYAGRYKVSLFFVIIFSVCSTIFNVVGPKILSTATTETLQRRCGYDERHRWNQFPEDRQRS